MNCAIDRERMSTPNPSIWVDRAITGNFFYQYIKDNSHIGVFIETPNPHPANTSVNLIFSDDKSEKLITRTGNVSFVNVDSETKKSLNPGMGIRLNISAEELDRLLPLINKIAYL